MVVALVGCMPLGVSWLMHVMPTDMMYLHPHPGCIPLSSTRPGYWWTQTPMGSVRSITGIVGAIGLPPCS